MSNPPSSPPLLADVPSCDAKYRADMREMRHRCRQLHILREQRALTPRSKLESFMEDSKTVLSLVVALGGLAVGLHSYRSANAEEKIAKMATETAKEKLVGTEKEISQMEVQIEEKKNLIKNQEATLAEKTEEIQRLDRNLAERLAQIELVEKAEDVKISDTLAKEKVEGSQLKPEEVKLADAQKDENADSDPKNREIQRLVGYLFAESGGQRAKGYEELTSDPEYRTSTFAVNRILEQGKEKIGKPDGFIGLYHTIVTLTGMSRAVTKDPDLREQIIDYANAVKDDQPRLENRVDTLLKWLGAD